jgi:hypothetical protein
LKHDKPDFGWSDLGTYIMPALGVMLLRSSFWGDERLTICGAEQIAGRIIPALGRRQSAHFQEVVDRTESSFAGTKVEILLATCHAAMRWASGSSGHDPQSGERTRVGVSNEPAPIRPGDNLQR